MNIVFLYAGEIIPERGGVQRVTSVLADYFEKSNIEVYYLSLSMSNDYKGLSSRQYFFPPHYDLIERKRYLENFLIENQIDILINQSGISPDVSELAYHAKKLNVKLISVIHNSILTGVLNFSSLYKTKAQKFKFSWLLPLTDCFYVKKILLFLYKYKYKSHYQQLVNNSDKVILLSDKFKWELEFITNKVRLGNIMSISNPLSFKNAKINLEDKKNELLFVGRIDTVYKRVDLLLEVWSKLYNKFPSWKLRIVGSGPEIDFVKDLSTKLGLERVYFEGFQNPEEYYRNASILCMTSSSESFGMVLIEAMQYGTVPFSFDSYLSVFDIIDDNVNGKLIPSFNCDEYANQLSVLMNKKDLRHDFAHNSKEKSNHFSIETIGSNWLNLFEDILSS